MLGKYGKEKVGRREEIKVFWNARSNEDEMNGAPQSATDRSVFY